MYSYNKLAWYICKNRVIISKIYYFVFLRDRGRIGNKILCLNLRQGRQQQIIRQYFVYDFNRLYVPCACLCKPVPAHSLMIRRSLNNRQAKAWQCPARPLKQINAQVTKGWNKTACKVSRAIPDQLLNAQAKARQGMTTAQGPVISLRNLIISNRIFLFLHLARSSMTTKINNKL